MLLASVPKDSQYLRALTAGAKPEFVISGYPEYGSDPAKLDSHQRAELHRAAVTILMSLYSKTPVRAALVLGHADKALRVAAQQRSAFEQEVSQKRADAGLTALLKQLADLAGSDGVTYLFRRHAIGIGNHNPIYKAAATEAQMRKNRRIEIYLARCPLSKPRCGVR
jgi:outer membrane protein OmpA-like peptidoglycan-associated protein